ncbi:hypothetical protein LMG22037_05618 [Paraburkholderia phenoliruptrix]|uniref:Uncharacterized protein n=1 Tax=Paraburkholderia phenoliruptrix TaxID=252970 RepID=A0A6J5C9P2_9BURK|nr:hypothetical protein [Paraburkholderia phenoliruptrix]CAB3731494.1 hypothetical protein LMG22037_05618 [Paraburkholderia phenoliruptrix]
MYKAMISGGLTVSAADLIPTVDWALHGFHGSVPANLSGLIAGAIVAAIHAGYNAWAARSAAKQVPAAQ